MVSLNPKKWFGRGKPKEEATAPPPKAPPAAPPEAPAEGKKAGRFRRLADKLKRKPKPKEEAPPPAPPEAPPAAPPTPPAPPAPPEAPAPPEREYPSSIEVEADGDWIISSTEWSGHMKGTIRGHKAKTFIDAYDKGDWNTCVQMVADAWDVNVADQIIPEQSTVDYISWS